MLSLDQVRLLENRVEKAVGKIRQLESENGKLRDQIAAFQTRIGELEGLVHAFKDDQGRIEEGILNALDRLSAFEDSVFAETGALALAGETETPEGETEEAAFAEETVPVDDLAAGSDPEGPDSNGQMDIF